MTAEVALPVSVNPQTWNADTAAMMEFAGLVWADQTPDGKVTRYAPAGVMAAFIAACNRTGLDPTAKQIYAAQMGGKWTVLVGIDGMRVVAQRTGEYDGQDPIEWQAEENGPWTTVPPQKPFSARARIYRKGVGRPLEQTVTLAEFGGRGGNWDKRPAHMLGIRAESHGFRRAFPMQLAGLYTSEDFQDGPDDYAIVVEPSEEWLDLIADAESKEDIKGIVERAREVNELTDAIRTAALTRYGMLNDSEQSAPADEEGDGSEPDPNDAEWIAAQAKHTDEELI